MIKRHHSGFTLVELLIVISVMAVLSVLASIKISDQVTGFKDNGLKDTLHFFKRARIFATTFNGASVVVEPQQIAMVECDKHWCSGISSENGYAANVALISFDQYGRSNTCNTLCRVTLNNSSDAVCINGNGGIFSC